jgi:hypothetical protein
VRRARGESCLSDLTLDRRLAGELQGRETRDAEAHLEACSDCRVRQRAIEAESAAFGGALPAALAVRAKAHGPRLRWIWAGAGALAAAGLAAIVLAVLPREPEELGVRLKGGFSLSVFARHSDGRVERLLPQARLRPGAQIRFEVSTPGEGYLAIVGIDRAGAVTAYHPAGGDAVPVAAGSNRLLDGSIVLDDTVGAERVVAVFCAARRSTAEVVAAGREALQRARGDPARLGSLRLPCAQSSLLFEKIAR